MKKKTLFISLAALTGVLGLALFAILPFYKQGIEIKIVNQSSVPLTDGSLEYFSQTTPVPDIRPYQAHIITLSLEDVPHAEGSIFYSFRQQGDQEDLDIRVAACSYVEKGYDGTARLVVADVGVVEVDDRCTY